MAAQPQIQTEYAVFRLKIAKSKIHRWGVYADEVIPANRKVIEYTGERISRRETKIRADRPLNYIFTLDSYWCIDGAAGGSGAQYINHCCRPNVDARIIREHILFFSKRKIKKGEELTLDYRFDKNVERVPCSCGVAECRGTINLK
jgi:SET domain-containing protein